MNTAQQLPEFLEPKPMEKFFNRAFGFLVGLGLGLQHNYLLQVRGRKTGRVYATPVNVLDVQGKRYLVAPRGRTQWVRNAETVGEITLKKGRYRHSFLFRTITHGGKPAWLTLHLARLAT